MKQMVERVNNKLKQLKQQQQKKFPGRVKNMEGEEAEEEDEEDIECDIQALSTFLHELGVANVQLDHQDHAQEGEQEDQA